MKAIVRRGYGSPDVLRYEDVAKPVPGENEVLIRVFAAAANPLDWHFIRGTPFFFRALTGFRKPRDPRVGVDVAGRVEVLGRNVKQFKPGDAVFGACNGSFAEYACAPESTLALKPENMAFEQAAAVPIAGLTALQGLRDKGHLQAGQKVLINGASGGVGTFAVQIAKALGAEVTGVCSTGNVEMVRQIGADRVIDYTQEEFTRSSRRYDILFDTVCNRSFAACRRVMSPRGTFIGIGGGRPDSGLLTPLAGLIGALATSWFVSQKLVVMVAKRNQDDLKTLSDLMKAGKVTPVIDRCYGLSQAPEAIRYLEAGHARGKVVIRLS